MLEVKDITYTIRRISILHGISCAFEKGKFSMIIGPNGSGKSTLLRVISGDLRPDSGRIRYGTMAGEPGHLKSLARIRATLSQQSLLSFPLTVEEVVMMGRYPHFEFKPTAKDEEICILALRKLQGEHLCGRNYLTLSGGERQRVHFAKTLAQIWEPSPEGRYLLLDEPIASLDPRFQHEFLNIARDLSKEGVTVVAVMHDINLAAAYGEYFVALKGGRVMAEGGHGQVMTAGVLSDLYDISCSEVKTEASGRSVFVFGV